ncbi:heme-binding protein [Neiella marina]|uniref:Heme-binding protein n=1 Tax=Neiella holothuriorum TaxID=2870530 RepID=A0ABS7EJF2_9GAMM|nr:heme-binding protein [Neiella holothuriorum]MBW8192471.1 heme-binding protein [Neiella holothuriorum]
MVWITSHKAKALLTAVLLGFYIGGAMAIEEPNYQLVEKVDEFELRAYSAMVIAETVAQGPIDDASSQGFRAVADFIFGNNTAKSGGSEKISMTAPVTIAPGSEAQTMQSEASLKNEQGMWKIHFVMPSAYSMDTLPEPSNQAVSLAEIPPRNMAVLRFSGLTGERKVAEKTQLLMDWMTSRNLTPKSAPKLARYNPPWTLPFWRRNEVMIEY